MDTMTLVFQDKSMIDVLRRLIKSMNGVTILRSSSEKAIDKESDASHSGLYDISPKIKAMETGFSLPSGISDDYKQELDEIKSQRYL